jgi:hypothetical protein
LVGVLVVADAGNHCIRKLYLPKAIDGAQGWQDHLRPIVDDNNIGIPLHSSILH